MEYIKVKLHTTETGYEIISAQLEDIGVEGIVVDSNSIIEEIENQEEYMWNYIDSSILENNELMGDEVTLSFYLEINEKGNEIFNKFKNMIQEMENKDINLSFDSKPVLGSLVIETCKISDESWKNKWKEFFKPKKITDHIVIKPSWEKYTKQKEEIVIEIDPGMAFGTGTHETTSMVIKLMEKYMIDKKNSDCKCKVLDIGCGSGILSIAACLLGADNVLGIDIDPVACEVAKENISLNECRDRVEIKCLDLTEGIEYKADLICANLVADLVVYLSQYAMNNLNSDGIFISSGILIEKKDFVKSNLKKNGYEIFDIIEEGEWCAIAAKYTGKHE